MISLLIAVAFFFIVFAIRPSRQVKPPKARAELTPVVSLLRVPGLLQGTIAFPDVPPLDVYAPDPLAPVELGPPATRRWTSRGRQRTTGMSSSRFGYRAAHSSGSITSWTMVISP